MHHVYESDVSTAVHDAVDRTVHEAFYRATIGEVYCEVIEAVDTAVNTLEASTEVYMTAREVVWEYEHD